MIEDYVPYIAAQTLKQVGFNEPTKAVFMNGQCMLLDSYSYNITRNVRSAIGTGNVT